MEKSRKTDTKISTVGISEGELLATVSFLFFQYCTVRIFCNDQRKEEGELSFFQTQRPTEKALGRVSAQKRAKLLRKHEDLVELVSFT